MNNYEFKRKSLVEWLNAMVPQEDYFLGSHASSYPENIRYFEAICRPLWGVLPDIAASNFNDLKYFKKFILLIRSNQLPKIDFQNRQIVVEMASVAYSFGKYPELFEQVLNQSEIRYFVTWLNQVNDVELPIGNWYFFRIIVNTALKINNQPYSLIHLDEAFKVIDSLYLGDGWYSDGENEQRDYYIAFAFHYYGLLYSNLVTDEKAEVYQWRAQKFSNDFIYWFDNSGRSIPFGRSLTYRFAHIAFWSAYIVSGAYKKSDLPLSQIKRIIMNHFAFWKSQLEQHNYFAPIKVGYGYPNLLLSEDYNAPGSSMWAFKSFVILELPDDHEFWQVKGTTISKQRYSLQRHPGFLIMVDENNAQNTALSAKQYSTNNLLYHHREKYGKFAYSSYFGFNLTRDIGAIENFAVDSTLAISIQGMNQFNSRSTILNSEMKSNYVMSEWLVSNLIKIKSYLVPITENQHVRIHQIDTESSIDIYEGGFPLHDWNKKANLSEISDLACLLANDNGIVEIKNLYGHHEACVVPQGPNTNIYNAERNGIPALKSTLHKGQHLIVASVFGSPNRLLKAMPVEFSIDKDNYWLITNQKKIGIPIH